MWERLTKSARQIIFAAQQEAREHNYDILDTEHVLLALAKDTETVTFRILQGVGIPSEQVQAQLILQMSRGTVVDAKDVTLSERMKRVVDYAFEEAAAFDNPYVGTEHLLLGLLRDEEGLAGKTLRGVGITVEDVRATVMKLQGPKA